MKFQVYKNSAEIIQKITFRRIRGGGGRTMVPLNMPLTITAVQLLACQGTEALLHMLGAFGRLEVGGQTCAA